MKRNILNSIILSLGLISAVGCVKEAADVPLIEGNMTVCLNTVSTKTVNYGLSTQWTTGDKINVFVAEAGAAAAEAVSCGVFEYVSDNNFTGTLPVALDPSQNYDWYFAYPYNEASVNAAEVKMTVGHVKDGYIVQKGNGSMEHLAGENLPMVGYAKNVKGGAKVSALMQHVAVVWEIEVVNKTDQVMCVSEITFPRNLDGKYRLGECNFNFTSYDRNNPIGWDGIITTDNATSQLNPVLKVEDAEYIAINASAKFYVPCMPFRYNSYENNYQQISVNGYAKDLSVASGKLMTQGTINRVKFNYDQSLLLNYTDYEFLKAIHDNQYLAPDGVEMVENINWGSCNGDGYFNGIKVQQIDGGKYFVTAISQTGDIKLKGFPEKMELPELTVLDFGWDGNTALHGKELPQVWSTPKLKKLVIQKSGLTGTIPQEFADNPSIREFYLGDNDFYGAFPHEWAAAGKIEVFNCSGNPGLGYLVPADLDVVFAWQCEFQTDRSALKLGGTADTWQGFEAGWGQARYERYDENALTGNTTIWSDARLLNGKAMGEHVVGDDDKDVWAWYYSDLGHIKKEMVVWNQADADAYTAKCRAERGL